MLVQLFNAQGTQVAQQLTDAQGNYCFAGLEAGEYSVSEIPTVRIYRCQEVLGTVVSDQGGVSQVGLVQNDQFEGIVLLAGDRGQNYNFGELQAAQCGGPGSSFRRRSPRHGSADHRFGKSANTDPGNHDLSWIGRVAAWFDV